MKIPTQLQKVSRMVNWILGYRIQKIAIKYHLPFVSMRTQSLEYKANLILEDLKDSIKEDYETYRKHYYETLHKAPTKTSN